MNNNTNSNKESKLISFCVLVAPTILVYFILGGCLKTERIINLLPFSLITIFKLLIFIIIAIFCISKQLEKIKNFDNHHNYPPDKLLDFLEIKYKKEFNNTNKEFKYTPKTLHIMLDCTEKMTAFIAMITIYTVILNLLNKNKLPFYTDYIALITTNYLLIEIFLYTTFKIYNSIIFILVYQQWNEKLVKFIIIPIIAFILFPMTFILPIYLGIQLAPSEPITFCTIENLPSELHRNWCTPKN